MQVHESPYLPGPERSHGLRVLLHVVKHLLDASVFKLYYFRLGPDLGLPARPVTARESAHLGPPGCIGGSENGTTEDTSAMKTIAELTLRMLAATALSLSVRRPVMITFAPAAAKRKALAMAK